MRAGASCACYFDDDTEGGVYVSFDTRDEDAGNFPKRCFSVECGKCGWEWDGNEKTRSEGVPPGGVGYFGTPYPEVEGDEEEDDTDGR